MLKNGVYSVIEGSERPGQSLRRSYCGVVPGSMTAKVAKVGTGRSPKSAVPVPPLTLRPRIYSSDPPHAGENLGPLSSRTWQPGSAPNVRPWRMCNGGKAGVHARSSIVNDASLDQPLLLQTAHREAISWYLPSQEPSPPADGSSETFASCSDWET